MENGFNLFDAMPAFQGHASDKPRKARADEMAAYAKWLAMRAGIPDAENVRLKLEYKGKGRDQICIGAHFGNVFVPFPGADQNGIVEVELLDESGNVERAFKMVRNGAKIDAPKADIAAMKAAAKLDKKARATIVKPSEAPALIAAPVIDTEILPHEAATSAIDIQPAQDSAPGIIAPENDATPPEAASDDAPADALADMLARIDALESAVAALSVETESPAAEPAGAIVGTDTGRAADRARRLIAVRRYLAVRKRRDEWRTAYVTASQGHAAEFERASTAESKAAHTETQRDYFKGQAEALRRAIDETAQRDRAKRLRIVRRYLAMRKQRAETWANAETWIIAARDKRRAAVMTGRGLTEQARRQRNAARAELSETKRRLADPTCPDRASDVARLIKERDEWHAIAAHHQQKLASVERSANAVAEHMEKMAGRLARAESAMRKAGLFDRPALAA